jgi:hypothetical protein
LDESLQKESDRCAYQNLSINQFKPNLDDVVACYNIQKQLNNIDESVLEDDFVTSSSSEDLDLDHDESIAGKSCGTNSPMSFFQRGSFNKFNSETPKVIVRR